MHLNLSARLKREPDGQFDDGDIAKIILDAIATPANSYGAHSTPECLRVIEIMGIQQARNWGVCTMNEFREFLGLKSKLFSIKRSPVELTVLSR